jgi:hypothetical protein
LARGASWDQRAQNRVLPRHNGGSGLSACPIESCASYIANNVAAALSNAELLTTITATGVYKLLK